MSDSASSERGPDAESKSGDAVRVVPIHYIKSNQFRVVHADGAMGGGTPNGEFISFALFSERLPFPLQVTQELRDGVLSEEVGRISREGIVREIEVNVVLSVDAADRVANWLQERIRELRTRQASQGNEP